MLQAKEKTQVVIDHHSALVYTMVLAAAADAGLTDQELESMSEHVRFMPVFRDFDHNRLLDIARDCSTLLADVKGLDKALDCIRDALPPKLRETAYAVACDVVASDGHASQEELRLLEMLRHHLEVDRLAAAAIERGARARHAVV